MEEKDFETTFDDFSISSSSPSSLSSGRAFGGAVSNRLRMFTELDAGTIASSAPWTIKIGTLFSQRFSQSVHRVHGEVVFGRFVRVNAHVSSKHGF